MNGTMEGLAQPATESNDVLTASNDVLSAVLRNGAQQLLSQAVEAEVASWIEQHRDVVDANGHRIVANRF